MRRLMLSAAVVLGLAACASAGAAGSGKGHGGSPDVITSAEITARPNLTTAFEAVQLLRPRFLQSRGQTSMNASNSAGMSQPLPVVFIDNQQFGGVQSLRDIPVSEVKEIRYISPADATTRWGTGYPNGVIQVVRRGK